MSHSSSIFMNDLISSLSLDLSGLIVYTEAASGPYSLCPIFALLAGADFVYAQTRDSRYATADDVIASNQKLAKKFGVADRLRIVKDRDYKGLSDAHIVTNSNLVRPIDRDLISSLSETAVIPLMWETWEFRPVEFDLEYCKARGVISLGTIEHKDPVNMLPYNGLLALKLLFELDFDCGNVLLVGGPRVFISPMLDYLRRIEIGVVWAGNDSQSDVSYANLPEYYRRLGSEFSVILIADQQEGSNIVGPNGVLNAQELTLVNPDIKLGVIAGGVDQVSLDGSSIKYLPKLLQPPGYMSYQPYLLGDRPVLTLFAGGLRVGEVMARARLRGLSPQDAVRFALDNSPAMDFVGDLSWIGAPADGASDVL